MFFYVARSMTWDNVINYERFSLYWNTTHWGIAFRVDGEPMGSVNLFSGPAMERYRLPRGHKFFFNNSDPTLSNLFHWVLPRSGTLPYLDILRSIPGLNGMSGPQVMKALPLAYNLYLEKCVEDFFKERETMMVGIDQAKLAFEAATLKAKEALGKHLKWKK